MIQKKAGIFLVSLFLAVLLLGVVSGQNACWIESGGEATCENAIGGQVIMGLSGPTNAHGELKIKNQALNYPVVLCCNFGNGVQADCPPSEDTILFLSSATNAHAEIPEAEGTTYTTEICYADMACVSTNPPENHNAILSLSGETNAHIGGPDDYDTKIYCQGEFLGTNLCFGGAPNGNLDSGEDCDTGNFCTDFCECGVGYEDDPDPLSTGCVLEPGLIPEAHWASSATTISYLNDEELYVGYTTIYMVLKYSGLSQDTVVSFEIFEDDTPGDLTTLDDNIRVGANARKGIVDITGKVVGNWTVSYTDMENADNFGEGEEYEFYFKVNDIKSNELEATVKEAPFCPTISLCLDYDGDQMACESDVCEVADFSVFLNHADIDCANNPDLTCSCWWNITEGTCNSRWVASGIGSCKNGEGVYEECTEENLFLEYSWTAIWTWDEGAIQDDPINLALKAKCIGGSNVLPCPALIQLPFINIYNIIAIIVVIILIYFLMDLKKKKRKVSKKKK